MGYRPLPFSFRVVLLVLAISTLSWAQCTCLGCRTDSNHCTGVSFSSYPNCIITCESGQPQSIAWADTLHPGALIRQIAGRFIVAGFLAPTSPTGFLAIGDEIIAVNGKPVGSPRCDPQAWAYKGRPESLILVQRNGERLELHVPLKPLGDYLSARWSGAASSVQSVSIQLVPTSYRPHPFSFGLKVIPSGGALVARDILLGSPAERRGLRIGDRILEVWLRGRLVPLSGSILEGGDVPTTVTLKIARGTELRMLSLQSVGIAALLATPYVTPAQLETASLR